MKNTISENMKYLLGQFNEKEVYVQNIESINDYNTFTFLLFQGKSDRNSFLYLDGDNIINSDAYKIPGNYRLNIKGMKETIVLSFIQKYRDSILSLRENMKSEKFVGLVFKVSKDYKNIILHNVTSPNFVLSRNALEKIGNQIGIKTLEYNIEDNIINVLNKFSKLDNFNYLIQNVSNPKVLTSIDNDIFTTEELLINIDIDKIYKIYNILYVSIFENYSVLDKLIMNSENEEEFIIGIKDTYLSLLYNKPEIISEEEFYLLENKIKVLLLEKYYLLRDKLLEYNKEKNGSNKKENGKD